MQGLVLLRYSSGIGACVGPVQYGCLLLLLWFVCTWIGACVGFGPVQFVVVHVVLVLVVAGTVGMGIRACAGYGMVRLLATVTAGRRYVPLYYSFRSGFSSCSCSSFRLLLCLPTPRVLLVLL